MKSAVLFLVRLQPIAGRLHDSWRRFAGNTHVLGQKIDVIVQRSMMADTLGSCEGRPPSRISGIRQHLHLLFLSQPHRATHPKDPLSRIDENIPERGYDDQPIFAVGLCQFAEIPDDVKCVD